MDMMQIARYRAAGLFDVRDQVAVVTGGAAGIGFAYAQVLAANGARVIVIDRDQQALASSVEALKAAGSYAAGIELDITDREKLRLTIGSIAKQHGRLDVVFANAGITAGPGFLRTDGKRDEAGAIENIPIELWRSVIDTNLSSVFTTLQASLPAMKSQKRGKLIVTTSIASVRPSAVVGTPYMIAKAAAAHLVRQLALEVGRFGINVNSIAPGPFLTKITSPGLKAIWENLLPVKRVAQTDEIKGLALFLASPASSFITGHQFVIDGGSLLGRAD